MTKDDSGAANKDFCRGRRLCQKGQCTLRSNKKPNFRARGRGRNETVWENISAGLKCAVQLRCSI